MERKGGYSQAGFWAGHAISRGLRAWGNPIWGCTRRKRAPLRLAPTPLDFLLLHTLPFLFLYLTSLLLFLHFLPLVFLALFFFYISLSPLKLWSRVCIFFYSSSFTYRVLFGLGGGCRGGFLSYEQCSPTRVRAPRATGVLEELTTNEWKEDER